MTPADLVQFILRERNAREEGERLAGLLTERALVDRGDAVAGLSPVAHRDGGILMRCETNISRLRSGDKVVLQNGQDRFQATLIQMGDHGRELDLLTTRDAGSIGQGPWMARPVTIDLTGPIIDALNRLRPGAPGWLLFQALAGEPVSLPSWSTVGESRLEEVARQVYAAAGNDLDSSQRAAVLDCLLQPAILGVQGPPGTGKTKVLAVTVEALSRLGKRVLVLAPTHQAVNNALSSIHRLFPQRGVIKVGDPLRRESLDDGIRCATLKQLPSGRGGPVVGLTFLSAAFQLVRGATSLAPNVVVVDEAGQLPLAQGALAGLMGAGSLLLFGDDMQMPPVFESDVSAEPLAVSIFGQLRQSRPGAIRVLRTSYRMNRPICHAIAQAFYPSELSSEDNLTPGRDNAGARFDSSYARQAASPFVGAVLDPEDALVWVDTDGTLARQENRLEAEAVAEVVASTLSAGLPTNRVAVVTPYRRQAVLVRHILQERMGAGVDLPIVDTVERVQGLTVDLIIVSLCSTDPEYVQATATFLFSPNRLNVALSRARTKAILFAARSATSVIPADFGALLAMDTHRRVLDQCRRVALPGVER